MTRRRCVLGLLLMAMVGGCLADDVTLRINGRSEFATGGGSSGYYQGARGRYRGNHVGVNATAAALGVIGGGALSLFFLESVEDVRRLNWPRQRVSAPPPVQARFPQLPPAAVRQRAPPLLPSVGYRR